ncbi:MAG: cbb3-type cytochrome c oxidase subunit I [Oligoflexales bacterium]|nr:cbb3-type cytochrome c oxidase subunit I [Oligoflexales bacterium]
MGHADSNYLNHEKGIWSWMSTLDHKRIGVMYMFTTLLFFLVGGIFALLVRTELWSPGKTIMSADSYNQAFSYHGTIMVFMVIIPMIPAAIGNFVLPMQLGAKDVAFPRLNLASYWVWLAGAAIAASTMALKGLDTGWTFYTPISISSRASTTLVLLGAFVMGFGGIFTAINFIASVHKLRAEGLTWDRLPLFIWAVYATNIIQLLATPALALTLGLLMLERMFGIGFFDPKLGGDPVLFQHFFWFYSHPAVYIMILPAMGIINEIIPVFSRKEIFGYKAMAAAIFGIAVVSFIVWGHHMYTSGQSDTSSFIFSMLTKLVGVATGIKVFSWVATMFQGRIILKAPMWWAFAFIFVFTVGGLTGIFLSTIATDIHLHDTYFVVAHFHYTMVGGALMAMMGGIHYWFPKFFGKMYNESAAFVSWFLVFVGFNLTFMPQFIAGTQGMPRRYYDYAPEFTTMNQISTVGAFMIATGFVWAAIYLAKALISGEKAPANPWGAATLEWMTASPPPHENFLVDPVVTSGPYDYTKMKN